MSINFNSKYDSEKENWIVNVSGELDVPCADILKDELNERIDEKFSDVILDMSDLQYIDSTGVGVIVGIMKRLKPEDKKISLINTKNNVKKIFKITGLDQIITLEG